MSYFSEWNARVEDTSNEKKYNEFVEHYYKTEQHAYDLIFTNYPSFDLQGTAKDISNRLEYNDKDMVFFVGFLEGLNPSLSNEIDLDNLDDTTLLNLEIDYEKLLYSMHDAKATWLYDLKSWDNVLSKSKRDEIAHQYRVDNIAVSTKIGRNEPCHCGSGLKYKKCHGK